MHATPTVALARWYRGKKRRLGGDEGNSTGDPRSALAALLKTDPEAAQYLETEVEKYRHKLNIKSREQPWVNDDEEYESEDFGELQVSTALFIEASGAGSGASLEEAYGLIHAAVEGREGSEGDEEVPGRWRAERLRIKRLLDAELYRKAALADHYTAAASKATPVVNAPRPPRCIPREDAATLTHAEFLTKYALPGVPVIITGGALIVTVGSGGSSSGSPATTNGGAGGGSGGGEAHPLPGSDWETFESLAAALDGPGGSSERSTEYSAGSAVRGLKVFREGSACWARLEEYVAPPASAPESSKKKKKKNLTAAEFVRGVGSGDEANRQQPAASSGDSGVPASTGSSGVGAGDADDGQGARYLHDWSLPLHAPHLARGLTVPKWFSKDLLVTLNNTSSSASSPVSPPALSLSNSASPSSSSSTPPTPAQPSSSSSSCRYSRSWPSLFVGPRGSKSDLHVDAGGTHFWQAVVLGTKFWRIYPRSHAPFLYPAQFEGSRDVVFAADAMASPTEASSADGSAGATAAAFLADPWEDMVEAGDLVFVPCDCPHFVQNLSDTVAISTNFVDPNSNVRRALEALEEEAWGDEPGGVGAVSSTTFSSSSGAGATRAALVEALRRFNEEGKEEEDPEPAHVPYPEMIR